MLNLLQKVKNPRHLTLCIGCTATTSIFTDCNTLQALLLTAQNGDILIFNGNISITSQDCSSGLPVVISKSLQITVSSEVLSVLSLFCGCCMNVASANKQRTPSCFHLDMLCTASC